MREVIKEARNVEDAIELACKELGVQRDAVDFEIITLPKRGFLGLRNTPARVRVFVEEPEPVSEIKKDRQPAPKEVQAAPTKEQRADRASQSEKKTQKSITKREPKREQPARAQVETAKKQDKNEHVGMEKQEKAAQTITFVEV